MSYIYLLNKGKVTVRSVGLKSSSKIIILNQDKTYKSINNLIVQVKEASLIHISGPTRKPQKILLCGWRRDVDDMIVVSPFY